MLKRERERERYRDRECGCVCKGILWNGCEGELARVRQREKRVKIEEHVNL